MCTPSACAITAEVSGEIVPVPSHASTATAVGVSFTNRTGTAEIARMT